MTESLRTYWRRLATGRGSGTGDAIILLLLTPLSLLYSLALSLRAALYRWGVFGTRHLPRPVISVGNITVGGTGKTPAAAHIAAMLLARGCRVALLSRGYGGSLEGQTVVVSDGRAIMVHAHESGDEPYLLASTIPGLMVVIGPDRYNAGMLAMEQLDPDIFLLDDGFQHIQLHRDLNVLLMDYSHPFGNGLTLPGGILREPPAAVQRADAVMFTRAPANAPVPTMIPGIPAFCSSHTLSDLLNLNSRTPVAFDSIGGRNVLAFAGIADPDGFFAGLRSAGVFLVHTISLQDHVDYDRRVCDEIAAEMAASGAELMITTEKDGVKLRLLTEEFGDRILLARMRLTIDRPDILNDLLSRVVRPDHET